MEQEFMKEKKVLPLVVSMSLPMVISMAVNSLYNIIDSYFVAKLSEDAMTALSLVYPVQNLVNAIAVGFGIGINASVAFYLGAGKQRYADLSAAWGVFLSFLHGAVLTVLCILGMPWFLQMFSADAQVVRLALIYAQRAFLFSIMITVGVAFEKIFQSVGKMKISMLSMMCGCVVNIILDPFMIFGIGIFPAMGIAGAAYATGIGQSVSLVIYVLCYLARPAAVKIRWKDMLLIFAPQTAGQPAGSFLEKSAAEASAIPESLAVLDRKLAVRLYGVGIPAALNMALPSFLISVLNGILGSFSDKYVLVLGVYYKLQTFIYLTANGIVQGIRPLISYNYGAREYRRVRQIFGTALKLSAVVMFVGTLLSWIVPSQLIGLFTSSGETVRMGVAALHIISLGFLVSAVSVTCSGTLEGLGKGMCSMWISLSRYVVVIIPAAFVFSRILGPEGVWYAFCTAEFISAGLSYLLYKKEVVM